jgi:hypothetical protein
VDCPFGVCRQINSFMNGGTASSFCKSPVTRIMGSLSGKTGLFQFPGDAGHQQKSQMIQFKSAAEMLETFGMSKGGKEYRRLVAAFERTLGATIFFGTDSLTSNAKVVHRARFNFFSEARIWYNRGSEDRLLGEPYENIIVLSNEFFEEVTTHPIPTDLEAVKLLSSAPAVLDLFVWLSYRCFTSKGPERIPIFGPFGLVQQLGAVEYTRPRNFEKNSISG